MIQCFSGWGRVRIATFSRVLNTSPHDWDLFSLSRMLNRELKGFLLWLRCFQLGQYVRLLVWWLPRRDINLRCNPCTMEATVECLFQHWSHLYHPYNCDPRGCIPSSTDATARQHVVVLEQHDWLKCCQFVLHVDYSFQCLKWLLQQYTDIWWVCTLNFCYGSCASLHIIDVSRD